MAEKDGQQYWQIEEPTRNEKVAVSTTSKIISEKRNDMNKRKVIVVRNISPNAADIITINLGTSQATADTGIILRQNESFSDTSETGYEAFNGTIHAICATINGQISIFER